MYSNTLRKQYQYWHWGNYSNKKTQKSLLVWFN